MADYAPNSTIRVLANVPLDDTYSDVIKFQSAAAQTTYFSGKAIATFTAATYQRVNSSVPGGRPANTCRVPAEADTLYNANYLMFQNTNYGAKWFYAFITRVNYISPSVTEIVYEIDHYQTWQFNMTVLPSFVEREHTLADGLFANREPEPVGSFPLYGLGGTSYNYSSDPQIVVCTAVDPEGDVVEGTIAGRTYSGLKFTTFRDAGAANNFIQSYAEAKPWVPNPDVPEQKGGKLDAVVCVFMSPYNVNSPPAPQNFQIPFPKSLSGYVPRNMKCFNSPWTGLILTSTAGGRIEFEWEGFLVPGVEAQFTVYFTTGYSPSLTCVPKGYVVMDNDGEDMTRALTVGNFPVCGWAGNVFANWMAQNQNAQFIGMLGNIVGVAGGMAGSYSAGGSAGYAGMAQAGASGFIDIAQKMNQREVMANDPGRAKGMPSPGNMLFEHGKIGFTLTNMTISAQAAAGIDAFFDMFGYATNRVKVPNMTGRASWNYVKTQNVIITGNMPVEAMATIKNMFNTGVRFWHGDFVGNYSLPNPIVEEEADATTSI